MTGQKVSMYFLGFDPGGARQFGWCVSEAPKDARLKLVRSGLANNAYEAVSLALQNIDRPYDVCAAGIDSPLFWSMKSNRKADVRIRQIMKDRGARNFGGTVQALNSLRGACVAQGILTTHILRDRLPSIRITETHPKALLWLIKVASVRRRTASVRISHLKELIDCKTNLRCEHQRDAVLGSIAAWAMCSRLPGWRDLFLDEEEPFVPVPPVEYWMPIDI